MIYRETLAWNVEWFTKDNPLYSFIQWWSGQTSIIGVELVQIWNHFIQINRAWILKTLLAEQEFLQNRYFQNPGVFGEKFILNWQKIDELWNKRISIYLNMDIFRRFFWCRESAWLVCECWISKLAWKCYFAMNCVIVKLPKISSSGIFNHYNS